MATLLNSNSKKDDFFESTCLNLISAINFISSQNYYFFIVQNFSEGLPKFISKQVSFSLLFFFLAFLFVPLHSVSSSVFSYLKRADELFSVSSSNRQLNKFLITVLCKKEGVSLRAFLNSVLEDLTKMALYTMIFTCCAFFSEAFVHTRPRYFADKPYLCKAYIMLVLSERYFLISPSKLSITEGTMISFANLATDCSFLCCCLCFSMLERLTGVPIFGL